MVRCDVVWYGVVWCAMCGVNILDGSHARNFGDVLLIR